MCAAARYDMYVGRASRRADMGLPGSTAAAAPRPCSTTFRSSDERNLPASSSAPRSALAGRTPGAGLSRSVRASAVSSAWVEGAPSPSSRCIPPISPEIRTRASAGSIPPSAGDGVGPLHAPLEVQASSFVAAFHDVKRRRPESDFDVLNPTTRAERTTAASLVSDACDTASQSPPALDGAPPGGVPPSYGTLGDVHLSNRLWYESRSIPAGPTLPPTAGRGTE